MTGAYLDASAAVKLLIHDAETQALDALHLAAAEQARKHLGCFVSYDGEQLHAAAALGWSVERPR